ncbi:MAG: hypothetical protein K0R83_2625, partial [Caulobacter sp.]|nr:hypothetical protein [Caulobacter sp.]
LDPDIAGSIGTEEWSRWRVRLDLAARVMTLSAR